jgi:ATP-dependent Lhr-like helicase
LNLVGGVLPGVKVPSLAPSRIVFRDGVPVATRAGGEVTLLQSLSPDDERSVRATLHHSNAAFVMADSPPTIS